MGLLSRYGSYGLIGLGWLLFSVIIPSAAGPSDAAPRDRLAAPPVTASGGAPPLIGSPRLAPLPVAPEVVPSVPTATPLAIATVPAVVVPPTATAAPALPASTRIVISRIKLDTRVIDVGVLAN